MRTNLRLLLDQCVQFELVKAIKNHSSVRAIWVNDSDELSGSTDFNLMNKAKLENRILVTVEGRLNERLFHICSHPGIIVFRATSQGDAVRADIFRRFIQSGQRSRASKAVTYLRLDGVTFKEQGPDGTVVETLLDWNRIKRHSRSTKTNYCDFEPP